jgi:hypothetical protein
MRAPALTRRKEDPWSHVETGGTTVGEKLQRFFCSALGERDAAMLIVERAVPDALRTIPSGARGEGLAFWLRRLLAAALRLHFHHGPLRPNAQALLDVLEGRGQSGAVDRLAVECFDLTTQAMNPRYAELVRAIDLRGEPKAVASFRLKLTSAGFDVTLHRARRQFRRHWEAQVFGRLP